MKIISDPQEMQTAAQELRRAGKSIGFVPTMGFLHAGHLSLMNIAREKADVVVVSIFVNPAQFGPNEDFATYPRDFERDEQLCRDAGVDLLFYPAPAAMYLPDHSVWIDEEKLSGGLCGAARPGHFRGVCTVVAKLMNIVLPDCMVMGEKDAQQLRIIRRMVRDLNFPVEIISGATVRAADGLALSSRNRYLSAKERAEAVCLSRALNRAQALVESGEYRVSQLEAVIWAEIEKTSGSIDYIEFVDDETLEPVDVVEKPVLAALAVCFSGARLIDHTVLKSIQFSGTAGAD
ncbi:MAG: pantoate--beta-alanine ligase [Kiritimatiellales bacterium]